MKQFCIKVVVFLVLINCPNALLTSLYAEITNDVTIDPEVRYQKFEGFGQGGMDQFIPYWYNVWSSVQLVDYLNKMYTLDGNGLGLEISRIPMPVGDAPAHAHMWAYSNQGYRSPESFELEDGIYNWNGHEDILWHIQGAAGRGVRMWAYWHSVPYWLTVSGCTSGNSDGSQDNLQSGQEARFAQHMCDVLDHFQDYWGVDFEFVGAINEADEDWWEYGGGQAGCHVSVSQAITIYQELKNEMTTRGLGAKLVGPDSFSAAIDHNLNYLDTLLDSSIGADIDALSCHQYWVTEEGMDQWYWRSVNYNRSLWMSEWGDWNNTGNNPGEQHLQAMNYAGKIQQALKDLRATSWIIWEPKFLLDVTDFGFTLRKSYWTVAQFSRFIRSGMEMVHSTDSSADCKTTIWIEPEAEPGGQKLVLVTVNTSGQAATINYDLSRFRGVQVSEVRQTWSDGNYSNIPFVQESPRLFC
jgi:O-glycosyl hydrolase